MELPVGFLIGLLYPHDPLHVGIDGDLVHVHGGGVAHQAQDAASHAVGDAHLEAHLLKAVGQGLDLLLLRAGFHYDYHSISILSVSGSFRPVHLCFT